MKAKLVKYPFNEKKYRWDTYAQEKEFEYYWDESLPKNFDTIEPYIKVEEYDPAKLDFYGYPDLDEIQAGLTSGISAYQEKTIGNAGHWNGGLDNTVTTFHAKPIETSKIIENYKIARYVYKKAKYLYGINQIDVLTSPTGTGTFSSYGEIYYNFEYNYLDTARARYLFCPVKDDNINSHSQYWRNLTGYTEYGCVVTGNYGMPITDEFWTRIVSIIGEHPWSEQVSYYNQNGEYKDWSNITWEDTNVNYWLNANGYACADYGCRNKYGEEPGGDGNCYTFVVEYKYPANETPPQSIQVKMYNRYYKGVRTSEDDYTILTLPLENTYYIGKKSEEYGNFTYAGFISNINKGQNKHLVLAITKNNYRNYNITDSQYNKIISGEISTNNLIKYLINAKKIIKLQKYISDYNNENIYDISVNISGGNIYIYDYSTSSNHINSCKIGDIYVDDYDEFITQNNLYTGSTTPLKYHYGDYPSEDDYLMNGKLKWITGNEVILTNEGKNFKIYDGYTKYYTFINNIEYILKVQKIAGSYIPEDELTNTVFIGEYFNIASYEDYVSKYITLTPSLSQKINRYLNIFRYYNGNIIKLDTPPTYSSSNTFITKNTVKLIGDTTDLMTTIPEENTTIFNYNVGEVVNNSFVLKTLKFDAPCEYTDYSVSSRTWLTFNTYSGWQWNNGYHFQGTQWNNIGSPFAYLNGITSSTGSRTMIYSFDVCPAGTYVNAFQYINGGFSVEDTDGNNYIKTTDYLEDYKHYWNDNVGSLWYFGSGSVSSTDRHAYPDNGTQAGYSYKLRPQDTKFLRYYRSRNTLTNVELYSDRYTYTHNTVDFCDRSLEGTTIGTTTSTNEESIPDGTWREYLGLYLGTSIPFLGIVETEIPPADILGVPQYDKQVNTSDTLKYGTVASASLTFTLNKPVGETLTHNNELLILYYDFKHRDEWERLGFFRVDSIEALDENTTSLMAHDEVYKLNKYVDDFLEDYTQTTTLDLFYRDLLNYCDCFYDTHQEIIHNGSLGMTNVYHAVKTTGVQVAHYVANLSPGFIHANIDGDVVLQQYQLKDDNLTIADYSNLVYTAYNTDMLDKVKIVSSNTVKGQSAGGSNKVYFLADNPLLSELQATSYFNNLAESILDIYNDIPTYRPATVDFLILPRELKIGDIVNLTTPKNETYKVIVMAMNISSSGVQIKSFGTQSYPVEAESNSEFVNLINDMGEISGDVSNMMEAQRTMANAIAENTEHIGTNTADITAIKQKNIQQDTSIGTNATNISNLTNTVNGYKTTTSNNLASIILSNTVNNVALKDYVDGVGSSTLASAKSYTDSLIGTSIGMKFGTIRWGTASSTTATNSVHCMYIGTNDKRNGIFIPTAFVADDYNRTYMFRVYNGSYFKLFDDGYSTGGRVGWFEIGAVSFTED